MHSYCIFSNKLHKKNPHRIYHDNEYGFPIKSDDELFGRLILEINQAGLSWDTIIKKKKDIRLAFSNFNIMQIAKYGQKDINRLMNNKSIIRNKVKIHSIIFNANQILELKKEYGSFKSWLDSHKEKNTNAWIKLFKQNFKFTGKEITKEFLISSAYIQGAHHEKCPIFNKIRSIQSLI